MDLFMDVKIGENILCSVFFIILLAVSLSDLYSMKIPDIFSAMIFIIGIISIFFIKDIRIYDRIAGIFVVSLPMILISLLLKKGFGGGDIKLMASSGFFMGAKLIIVGAALGMFMAGAYIGIAYMTGNRSMGKGLALGPCLSIGMIISCMLGLQIWYKIF